MYPWLIRPLSLEKLLSGQNRHARFPDQSHSRHAMSHICRCRWHSTFPVSLAHIGCQLWVRISTEGRVSEGEHVSFTNNSQISQPMFVSERYLFVRGPASNRANKGVCQYVKQSWTASSAVKWSGMGFATLLASPPFRVQSASDLLWSASSLYLPSSPCTCTGTFHRHRRSTNPNLHSVNLWFSGTRLVVWNMSDSDFPL